MLLASSCLQDDLDAERDEGDDESDESGDEDAAERLQRDPVRVVEHRAVAHLGVVPVSALQRLKVPTNMDIDEQG